MKRLGKGLYLPGSTVGAQTRSFSSAKRPKSRCPGWGNTPWKACKNCKDYRKIHKRKETKKPSFQNNWCWLLENGLSPLAGENHWQICFCARVVFLVRSDSPCATGAIQGNCLKVTSLRKTLAYYAYPYSSPSHYILLFSYSSLFLPFSLVSHFHSLSTWPLKSKKQIICKCASTNNCMKS